MSAQLLFCFFAAGASTSTIEFRFCAGDAAAEEALEFAIAESAENHREPAFWHQQIKFHLEISAKICGTTRTFFLVICISLDNESDLGQDVPFLVNCQLSFKESFESLHANLVLAVGQQVKLKIQIRAELFGIAESLYSYLHKLVFVLAARPEMQVSSDWMLVPAARNLHWRYEVLHSAFMVCKQKVAPGESLQQNLDELIVAVRKIWECISKNTVSINNQKRNINGNIGMLFSADDVTVAEKTILRAYLNTTSNIAGCQAIRRKIGHCCFGLRVAQGEAIFVTVSPNRRNSSMILKLSRARRNDTSLSGDDPVTHARRKFCGKDSPNIFVRNCYVDDKDGGTTTKEIPLPPLWIQQACNSQDPMSSCHHYLFFMRVILPTIFGVRMCFLCPDCNADTNDPHYHDGANSCSDYMGCNSKLMGGYAGIATALCFATEYQGEATPHGHGFVSLANAYRHHTLEEIGNLIERNAQGITPEAMVERITRFCEHLERADHFDQELRADHIGN